ncbi:MAG: MoxR family ATPase [Nitrososphaerota archaeon]|jgi:MoxR-like ATPase|nr:MoxR family ATPase [Nitrososphaerota archaeon]MDG6900123.1 MoxR family ATPase [Nitrososphaerota archaeon]MDG6913104.1 MoxR family ATPase [Nitrososphaerota archaeon]MDG6941288.1 MoxR family ATPase [Nitrososphaerota archaeon]MDG6962190.1 MoxR family ATPase [Nitrososphaerota archaeon]
MSAEAEAVHQRIITEVSKAIIGKRDVLDLLLLAVVAGGHVLIEDFPGLAKTLMAKSFASALGLGFRRIQFTPDLLPADVTGSYVLDPRSSKFGLRKGPVFTNILLADEINRAPPRTQSALLEAMQEKQVTIEGETLKMDDPFVVIATQNPIEYEGTYPLPEAQLDRFLMKLGVGYPEAVEEREILKRRDRAMSDDIEVNPVTKPEGIRMMKREIESIHLEDVLEDYIVGIVRATREHKDVDVGASPRGSLALMKLSKGKAFLDGRGYVVPDDVKSIAVPALSHRLVLKAEGWMKGKRPEAVVEEALRSVPVPKVD